MKKIIVVGVLMILTIFLTSLNISFADTDDSTKEDNPAELSDLKIKPDYKYTSPTESNLNMEKPKTTNDENILKEYKDKYDDLPIRPALTTDNDGVVIELNIKK